MRLRGHNQRDFSRVSPVRVSILIRLVQGVCQMKAETICLRCHQKCQLTAEVENGKITRIEDSSLIAPNANADSTRTSVLSEVCIKTL